MIVLVLVLGDGETTAARPLAAESAADVHHGAPSCLLGLFDAAAGGIAD
jgi:hypothetical protein